MKVNISVNVELDLGNFDGPTFLNRYLRDIIDEVEKIGSADLQKNSKELKNLGK